MNRLRFVIANCLLFLTCFTVAYTQEASNTLAVLPFNSSSIERKFIRFANGIPDMLMGNLSNSQEIKLVERTQVEKAYKHFAIEQSGLIDETKAIRIGNWIGAKWILIGNLTVIDNNARLDGRLIDVKTGMLLKAAFSKGKTNELIDLVDDLAKKLLEAFTGETVAIGERVLLDKVFRYDIANSSNIVTYLQQANKRPPSHTIYMNTDKEYRFELRVTQGVSPWNNTFESYFTIFPRLLDYKHLNHHEFNRLELVFEWGELPSKGSEKIVQKEYDFGQIRSGLKGRKHVSIWAKILDFGTIRMSESDRREFHGQPPPNLPTWIEYKVILTIKDVSN